MLDQDEDQDGDYGMPCWEMGAYCVMEVMTVILAHGDAMEAVQRHLPLWRKHTDGLAIVSPNNNPCIVEGVDCFTHEGRQHHGQLALRRQLFAMKAALLYKAEYYVFMEYDAIMLRRPAHRPIVQGNLFNEQIFKARDVESKFCFLHFPWVFPACVLQSFIEKAVIDPADEVAHDVWVARRLMQFDMGVCNQNGRGGNGEGFSANSIDNLALIAQAVHSARAGAYAFHGIKTKAVLDQILEVAA
jgi:hypothetical protein